MDGLVSLDGAEGITSVGVNSYDGAEIRSIGLSNNRILTSTIALANAKYPAGTLYVSLIPSLYASTNFNLGCVPSAWPYQDMYSNMIPHGSCPTTPAPTPAPVPGSTGSTLVVIAGMLVVIAVVIAALACAAGFVYYRKRASAAHKESLDGNEVEMVSLGTALPPAPAPAPAPALAPAPAPAAFSEKWRNQVKLLEVAASAMTTGKLIGSGGFARVYEGSIRLVTQKKDV
jgi:hypothetical protein